MDKRISQLVEATTLNDSDVLPIVNGGETKKVSIASIKEEVNVNADWNATSGDALILNKPTIPSAVTETSQLTNNGADGINPFITALDIPTQNQASTLVREVKNMTGATLTKGTVVYISGANGNKPLVSKAQANTDALSARTFGLLQSDILNNGLGNCIIIGDLTGVDTSAFADGTQLYLSGTTAGTYTSTKPFAPIHLVYVGKVTRSHPTLGQIEVGIQNGYELDEIHDVLIVTPTNNQALIYESATDLWKNKTIGIQQVLDNGNSTQTGINFNPPTESTAIQVNLSDDSSNAIAIQTDSTLDLVNPIILSNENEEIFKVDNLGNVRAKSIIKDGGLNTQFLMADGSVSSGGTPPINPYSILANNTNASATPTSKVYKEVEEKTLSGTGMTATGGTLPTGTQTHSYRWSQIGNLVTLRINLQFATAGTCSGIAIPFANMSDIPQTPQHASIYTNALEMITYGSGNLSANKLIGVFSAGNGASGIRLSASANTYEVVVGRASSSYANGWIHIQYYI